MEFLANPIECRQLVGMFRVADFQSADAAALKTLRFCIQQLLEQQEVRPPPPLCRVHVDAPGQRHGQKPVSGMANPRSSQTGQVIRGLR